ncbi:MAG: ABC transporter transmembrane domain-containing protein [Immundisolibacter sp.]|uniref:ABC transporter transmembrane domain-containing protein n=1 Tax=Immundisolibacter sp. TaxID=1934948 RepID=UPI003D12425C
MISLWRGRRVLFAGLVAASLGLAGLAATVAYCVQVGVDALVRGKPLPGQALALGAVFLGMAGLGVVLEIFRTRAAERIGLGYVAQLRAALFERVLRASPELLAQRGQGGLLLPFVGDLTAIKKWVSDGLVRLISAVVSSVLLLGVLTGKSPLLGLAAGAVLLCAMLAVLALAAPLNSAIRETRHRRGAIAAFVSRSIRGAGTIRAFHRFDRERKRLARRNAALMTAGLRLAGISGAMTATVHVAALMLMAVTLLVGAAQVRTGAVSIGVVAAALSISGLLAGAVRDLGVAFELWRRAKVSLGKIKNALAIEAAVTPARSRRGPLDGHAAAVALRGVAIDGLIANFSADLTCGDVINVAGASGAGKSALLASIARLRDADHGRVRIAGRNVRDMHERTLRSLIGYAGPAAPLLPGSIGMNLRYRAPGAAQDEITHVMACCNIAPILARLPRGLDTRLREGAPELSSNERQRLEIARAMLGKPPVLILDGVDTHLDEDSASRLAVALADYDGVVLLAATAPVLQRIATMTWRIDNGTVRATAGPGRRLELVRHESIEGYR